MADFSMQGCLKGLIGWNQGLNTRAEAHQSLRVTEPALGAGEGALARERRQHLYQSKQFPKPPSQPSLPTPQLCKPGRPSSRP
jgi:hypothetical protein